MSSKQNLLSYKVKRMSEVQIKARKSIEALMEVKINFDMDVIEKYGYFVAALQRNVYLWKPKKLELDMKHREASSVKPFIEEASTLKI